VRPPPVRADNDFYPHNVMVGAVNHGEIVGVFDWEMSTIGDPLGDLGIVMNYWRDKNDLPELLGASQGEAHTLRPGFLTRDELLQRYATRTGRQVCAMPYYWARAHCTPATLVEQIYVRYVRGQTTDPRFALMGPMAPALALA